MILTAFKKKFFKAVQWTGDNLDEIKSISNFDELSIRLPQQVIDARISSLSGSESWEIRRGDFLLSFNDEEYLSVTSDRFAKDWVVFNNQTPDEENTKNKDDTDIESTCVQQST